MCCWCRWYREHHGNVLSNGDQHDAAEAFELLADGLHSQLQRWFEMTQRHDLQTASLQHLAAISRLPASTGKQQLGASLGRAAYARRKRPQHVLATLGIAQWNLAVVASRHRHARSESFSASVAGYQAAELPSPARLFSAWRELTTLPMRGTLKEESFCLACRSTSMCQLTPFSLLTLPIGKCLNIRFCMPPVVVFTCSAWCCTVAYSLGIDTMLSILQPASDLFWRDEQCVCRCCSAHPAALSGGLFRLRLCARRGVRQVRRVSPTDCAAWTPELSNAALYRFREA